MRPPRAAMVLAAFLQWPLPQQLWQGAERAPLRRPEAERGTWRASTASPSVGPTACDLAAWRTLVQTHLTRYPEMEVHDLYKLLHQGVFGSEHAVPDRSTAAEWLRKEIAELEAEEERPGPRRAPAGDEGRPPVSGRAVHARDGAPLVEPIAPDGAVVRVHLRPFLAAGGDPEALLDAFVATANQPRGDAATFRCAAEAAGAAVGARWPDGAWPAYVEAREAEGLPAVHHSDRFAAAYRPAYRVVGAEGAAELLKIRASFRR